MKPGVKPPEIVEKLVSGALGRIRASLVIRRGALVNVFTGEIVENTDIAVVDDRIVLVGDAEHTIGPETRIIDAYRKYLTPGFLDGHVHVESSMLTVTQFAKAVLPHGTTTVFIDPHEIANVLGIKGVKMMHDEGLGLPLKVYVSIPSCVPATSLEFETSGAEIGLKEVEEAFSWRNTIALGEIMNYPGVLSLDPKIIGEVKTALRSSRIVEGHFFGNLNEELNAYVAAGISSDHESVTMEAGLAKLRLGMHVMVREASAWKDLKEVIRMVTEKKVNARRICLVSDDREPSDLLKEGHIDHIVRRAIEEGVDPVTSIQMATLNTAEHFKVDGEIGALAPGMIADILILSDLNRVLVDTVIANGRVVARNGRLVAEMPEYQYPEEAKRTVRVGRKLDEKDFKIRVDPNKEVFKVRTIQVVEAKTLTRSMLVDMRQRNGFLEADPEQDIAKVAVVERHRASGNIGIGFVKGFGFKNGAVASTVAHDSHNMLILGVNDRDMALAGNTLAEAGGGMVAVENSRILALLELPIAGLMSDKPVQEVAANVEKLSEAWRRLGCVMTRPFMTMSLLALPVLPELRITDKGLIDTVNFQRTSLILE
ncbi:MAG: adenine deaminase [Candidatus Brockarchaeota archaeon]|nr:adenine deaminase [Candidatus Brockarchaeota archaeon]